MKPLRGPCLSLFDVTNTSYVVDFLSSTEASLIVAIKQAKPGDKELSRKRTQSQRLGVSFSQWKSLCGGRIANYLLPDGNGEELQKA